MADRELSLILKLKDQASKELKGFNDKLSKMQPTFKKMAVAGTVAFAAVSAVIVSSTRAFQEQEKAEARLAQIATKVSGATEEQIESFKKLAVEMQKTGVVGDEVVIAGQSQIASFTKNADVISMLSAGLGDLAVAQYGVEVTQEQAIQTANIMGKALTGQLGALTRTGILVSGDLKEAFESANTEEERAIVLTKIIADNYGGLNEALRDTSAGGIQAFKNSMGDLNETIGGAFTETLNNLLEKINPVIERFSAWAKENPEQVKRITLFALAISGLVAGIGFLGLILPAIISGFSFLTVPVLIVIGLFATLTTIFMKNKEIVKKFIDEALIFLSIAIEAISPFVEELFKQLGFLWEKLKELWKLLEPTLIPVLKTVAKILGGVLFLAIVGIIEILITMIVLVVNIATKFVSAFNFIVVYVRDFWLKNIITVFQNAGSAWKEFFESIGNLFGKLKDKFIELLGLIKDGFKGTINFLIGLFEGFVNSILRGVNSIIKAINKITGYSSVVGIDIPKIGEIPGLTLPRLAEGGIVTSPTTALIGEAGAEAVIPLNKFAGIGGVTVNVYGDVSGRDLIEKVEEAIMRKIKTNNRI